MDGEAHLDQATRMLPGVCKSMFFRCFVIPCLTALIQNLFVRLAVPFQPTPPRRKNLHTLVPSAYTSSLKTMVLMPTAKLIVISTANSTSVTVPAHIGIRFGCFGFVSHIMSCCWLEGLSANKGMATCNSYSAE
eukprot:6265437-Amphidinium_carterae.1